MVAELRHIFLADHDWHMVGRETETEQFKSLVLRREMSGIVISGSLGVGKSRLARECMSIADRLGMATAWVTATRSGQALPLAALAPLLPATDTLDRGANRTAMIRNLSAHLLTAANGRRLLLVVDDAHLLDETSAMLIHRLAVHQAAVVLVTVRTGEPAPDLVTALWKDGLAARIELGGLPVKAVERILVGALGQAVDAETVAQLTLHSDGNALFLRELTAGALGDGTLVCEYGSWQLIGALSPSVRLVELVGSRLRDLADRGRDLLEYIAYAEVIGSAELEAIADGTVAADLERRGFLVSRVSGRRLEIRMAHPLYGDVVRAMTPAVRLRSMARALAAVVEAHGARRREDPLRVATWRLDGGGPVSPQLMLTAATTARWRYDFALAERLAQAAVAAGAGFDAALLVARLSNLQGDSEEAERQLARLADLAASDAERAIAAIARSDNLVFSFGRGAEALAVIEGVEPLITDPEWRAQLAARRSAALLATDGPAVAARAAQEVIDSGYASAQAWASMFAAYLWSRMGQIDASLASADRGRSQHHTSELDWYPWFFSFVTCGAFARSGRLVDSQALAETHYVQSLAEGSTEARAFFAWHLARSVTETGDVGPAIDHAQESARLFAALGRPTFERNALITLSVGLALAGRAPEAQEALARADALPAGRTAWTAVELLEAQAWTAIAAGALHRGRALLLEAANVGEEIGDLVGAAAALHGLARLGRAKEYHVRLTSLASRVEGVLVTTRAAHARALVAHDAAGLEDVSRAFEDMGANLLAAEAAADACRAWVHAGDHRGLGARRRATSLAEGLGATTPGLHLAALDSQLTAAEHEAAVLAASGLTNREIADQLTLSVRTVENRLQRCYQKLGVACRGDLRSIFDR
jgi:DNA-binding NarL/FixJ family response regulator